MITGHSCKNNSKGQYPLKASNIFWCMLKNSYLSCLFHLKDISRLFLWHFALNWYIFSSLQEFIKQMLCSLHCKVHTYYHKIWNIRVETQGKTEKEENYKKLTPKISTKARTKLIFTFILLFSNSLIPIWLNNMKIILNAESSLSVKYVEWST